MIHPALWTDVMRWWSVLGAIIGVLRLAPAWWRVVRTRVLGGSGPVPLPQLPLIVAGGALLFFLLFAIIAGAVLPLTTRVAWLGYYSLTLQQILAVAWTIAGIASWATAIAFVRSTRLVGAMSFTWFAAMWFAVTATSGM